MKTISEKAIIACLFVFFSLSLHIQEAYATDIWPMFRHDLEHTGRSDLIGAQAPAGLKWMCPLGDGVRDSSPAIAPDGTIYIGASDGNLYAVNPNGTIYWTYSVGGLVYSSPAIGADGTIYVGATRSGGGLELCTGAVYAIYPDGTLRWRYPVSGYIMDIQSSPAIDPESEVIYIGGHCQDPWGGRMYAINPDGTLMCEFNPGSSGWMPASPAIRADGKILIGDYSNPDGRMRLINPDDCSLYDYVQVPNPGGEIDIYSSAAIDSSTSRIYFGGSVGDASRRLWAYDFDLNYVWDFVTGGYVPGSPAIGYDGTIYIGSYDNKLYAVNPDGSLQWSYTTGGDIFSSPAIDAEGTIYVGSNDHNVYAFNPDGTVKWIYTTGGAVYSSPAIGTDETIYVGSIDGFLYALKSSCCEATPSAIDFGSVCVGSYLDTVFTIKNIRDCGDLIGNVTESCDEYSIVSGGGPYNLALGESLDVTVRYEPVSFGEHVCMIETGNDNCTDIHCEGFGITNCEITPDYLNFGAVSVGNYKEMSFKIANSCGIELLEGIVSESCDQFSIVSGGGYYSIAPGDSIIVTVSFHPDTSGVFYCIIETGSEMCVDVYCVGTTPRDPEREYLQGKRIKQEWTYSEFQTADDPGSLPMSTSAAADTYLIVYNDFGTYDWQGWIPYDNAGAYGNYAGLWEDLLDKDPCSRNFRTQVEFFANVDSMNYGPSSYDYPGLYETPYGTPSGMYQDEMIISPVIDMTMYTTRSDGIQDHVIPPEDLPTLGGAQLRFTVYRDLEMTSLVFYYWLVRNIEGDIPGPWLGRNLLYYGAEQDYQCEIHDISDLVGSDEIQVAIGVVDMCDTWFDVYGSGCYGHTPSPWIDNVHIKRYTSEGPQWGYRSIDLFQDNFPEGEDIEGWVRADMAMDINNPDISAIDPGDSVVISCSSWNAGGLRENGYGAEVFLHVKCTYIGDPDPPFGPKPDIVGPSLEGNYGVFFDVDGAWTIIQCDSVQTGVSHPDCIKYCVDLNDSLLTRGYMLEYYFKAYDNAGNSSTLPRRAEPLSQFFEFTCLPTMASDVLYVDDFHGRGSIDGAVHSYIENSLETILESGVWDRYDVNGPSSLVSNGLGSRAYIGHMIMAYSKVIWDSGNLRYGTISDGFVGDKSMDCQLLNDWLYLSDHDVGIWICGDNIAYDLDMLVSADAFILKNQICGVALNYDSYYDLTMYSGYGGLITPCVKSVTGSIFDHGEPASFAVYGGCPGINAFDVLDMSPDGPPSSQPALRYYEGCNSCSTEPPGGENAYAAITNTFTNDVGYTVRTMWFGFSLMYMSDCDTEVPIIRNQIMADVISWMDNLTNPDITGDEDTPPAYTYYLERNYPNPFNPVTTIRFGLRKRGHVTLKIYNVAGSLIKTLVNQTLPAGNHFKDWTGDNNHGSQVASGIYFYRIESGNFSETKKMVLIR
jgi:outer membrane protein assembly factor BamB